MDWKLLSPCCSHRESSTVFVAMKTSGEKCVALMGGSWSNVSGYVWVHHGLTAVDHGSVNSEWWFVGLKLARTKFVHNLAQLNSWLCVPNMTRFTHQLLFNRFRNYHGWPSTTVGGSEPHRSKRYNPLSQVAKSPLAMFSHSLDFPFSFRSAALTTNPKLSRSWDARLVHGPRIQQTYCA